MRFVLIAVLLAACSQTGMNAPRYSADIFAEDTTPVAVTVKVTGPLQVNLNGAGFYMYKGEPVVLTPASLVVRGTGSAIISGVDTTKQISIVLSGTPLDSTDKAAIVARRLKLSRPEGATTYKLEVLLP